MDDREHRGSIELPPQWWRDVAMWLRVPQRGMDARGWPMLLVPHHIDPDLRFPDSAMHVFQSISWSEAPPVGQTMDGRAVLRWVQASGEHFELGLHTEASVGGRVLASTLIVARCEAGADDDIDSFGRRAVPDVPPVVGRPTRRKQLAIGEDDLAEFGRFVGHEYPLHGDLRFVRTRGFPNLLVQGHAQLLTMMAFAGVSDTGTVEAWFRYPVYVGSALVSTATPSVDGEGQVWTLRPHAKPDPATIMRIS